MNQSTEKSTFLIKSTKNSSFGTGFVVYKDEKGTYLLSCAHVIEDCGKDTLMVENQKAQLLYIGSREAIDLALIYVEGLDGAALKLSDAMVSQGVLFEVYGFQQHLHGNYKLEMLKGSIKKLSTLYSGSQKVDSYDLSIGRDDNIQRGYSGSAILCPSSGHVIAVATSRYNDKHAEAIPIGYLKSIWQEIPDGLLDHQPCLDMPKEEKKSFALWLKKYLLVTIGGVIILGLLAYFLSTKDTQKMIIIGDKNKGTQTIGGSKKSASSQTMEVKGSNNTAEQIINLDTNEKELCQNGIAQYQESIDELNEELKSAKMPESKKIISRDLEKIKQQLVNFRKECNQGVSP